MKSKPNQPSPNKEDKHGTNPEQQIPEPQEMDQQQADSQNPNATQVPNHDLDLATLSVKSENAEGGKPNLDSLSPPPPLNAGLLESLRIEASDIGDSVPVPSVPKLCKPGKQTFFKVKGDPSQWPIYHTFVPEGEMGQSTYLVSPDVAAMLGPVVSQKRLVTCITLEGDIFFWPLTVSDRPNGYSDSARIIAGEAITEWRRMAADLKAKEYRAWKPRVPKPDPVWPTDEELKTMLLKAVDGKIIDSVDHPEVLKLL